MTWLVFMLIVAAAALYLWLAESRADTRVDESNDAALVLADERTRIENQLKDLEYESGVGKIDPKEYSRLQSELLVEYESLETRINALPGKPSPSGKPTGNCGECGSQVLTQLAKFCHVCGAKLAGLLLVLLVSGGFIREVSAFDARVTVKNGTTGQLVATPLSVQLLKLEQGMQALTAQPLVRGKVSFLNLPEMTAGPYMVQAVYEGVTYSRVIAPNVTSGSEIVLEVFSSTSNVDELKVRTLVEIRRSAADKLTGLMILFLVNSGRRTVVGGPDGLEFALPAGAELEQASISVGTGTSNIQWLKLNPKLTTRPGIYSVAQYAKPGERILQVTFNVPYKAEGTAVKFQSLYPMGAGLQLIAEPENLEVRSGGNLLRRTVDPNLQRGLIGFSPQEKEVSIMLTGGDIVPQSASTNEDADVEIHSPLSLTEKLLFPAITLLVFFIAAMLRKRYRQNPRHS